jgi:hypothetical protein
MKVRFYKITLILNGVETVWYIPASGKNSITQIVNGLNLPIVKVEFLGWHIVNIFCNKDGVYFSANIQGVTNLYHRNQLGFEYLFNCLDYPKAKRVSHNSTV